jgi:hypothetical protein
MASSSGLFNNDLKIIQEQQTRQSNILKAIQDYVMCETEDEQPLLKAIGSQAIVAAKEDVFAFVLQKELTLPTLIQLKDWLVGRIKIPLYQPSSRIAQKAGKDSVKSGVAHGVFSGLLGGPIALMVAAKTAWHQGATQYQYRVDGRDRAQKMLAAVDAILIERQYAETVVAVDREIDELGLYLPDTEFVDVAPENEGLIDAASIDEQVATDEQEADEPVPLPDKKPGEEDSLRRSGPTM